MTRVEYNLPYGRVAVVDYDEFDIAKITREAMDSLMTAFSKSPTQTGKWIGGELGFCTCCGHEGCASDIWDRCTYTFCPNCGAYLEVEGIK